MVVVDSISSIIISYIIKYIIIIIYIPPLLRARLDTMCTSIAACVRAVSTTDNGTGARPELDELHEDYYFQVPVWSKKCDI